jgi:LruC domain-containing protein
LEGLSPADIQSVSGTTAPSITTTSGGCESGQSKAVLIVYDNGHTLMGARNGQFINTSDTAGVILDPVELQIEVVFTTPQASIGEINPFIFTKGIRGNEIHLKGFAPTDLVDNNLFGTFSDASEGTNTYQTANGMPWGLSFSTEFSYPKEKANFLDAYPFFSNWVLSGGSEQTNWYLSSKATPAYLFQ